MGLTTLVTAALGCLVLIGIPWASASYWVSHRVVGIHDRLERFALGFAGVGVATWAAWMSSRLLGPQPVALVAATIIVSSVLVLDAKRLPRSLPSLPKGASRPVLAMGVAFVLLLAPTFVSFGLTHSGGVHTLAMTDWYKHLTVTSAIAGADAFPPANPFLQAHAQPSYYFGFHLLAAAVSRLTSVAGDVYPALLVLTAVIGFSVPLVMYAYARPFGDQRFAVVAAAACFLYGFDLVVVAVDSVRSAWGAWPWPGGLEAVRALVPSTHLDYWIHHNERQFNAFFTATAWAPQHVAAALLALVALSLVSSTPSGQSARRSGILLPALVLASLPAMSAYVAVALVVGVGVWLAVAVWPYRWEPWRAPEFRRWVPVGFASMLLSLPILTVLSGGEGSGSDLSFGLSGSGGWINGAVWNAIFGSHWWTNLLDTPAVYLVEFGIIGVLAAVEITRWFRGSAERAAGVRAPIVIVLAILTLVTFFRPPPDGPNNLYARPMLLVFAMLVPLAIRGAERVTRVGWLRTATVVCALGTGYALAGMVLQGLLFWSVPPALADACAWATRETPRSAVLAVHPDEFSRHIGFFCRRPLTIADVGHARLLGASTELYERTSHAVDDAFSAASASDVAGRLDDLGVDTVLVRSGSGGAAPDWLASPCFTIPYSNAEWTVGVRAPAHCLGP